MRILIKGFGHIARRHIRNIRVLNPASHIAIWRHDSQSDLDVGEFKSIIEKIFLNRQEALAWQPHIVFVTDPAPFHVETALAFARRGSHVFVEKPLSTSLENVDVLLRECEERKLVLMVGYVLRFLKPLKLVKQALMEDRIGKVLCIRSTVGHYLCDWRPSRDYRTTVSAQKKLGGGVLFELSHELDTVRWLVGEVQAIQALTAKISDLDLDLVEDTAELLLKFRSGAIGSIHLDMIDPAQNRSCRVIGTRGTLHWNAEEAHTVRLYKAKEKEWVDLYSDSSLYSNEMYLEEVRHFFRCVEKRLS